MDAELLWTAVGTVGTCAGLVLAHAQLRTQRPRRRTPGGGGLGASVAPPVGGLPAEVRGRDGVMRELRRKVARPPSAFVVLTGMGGVGKSTVAASVAERAAAGHLRRRRRVWWVSSVDEAGLTAGLITVARRLGADPSDVEAISTRSADAPDRLWRLLERSRTRWLLVFDNADDLEALFVPEHPESGGTAVGSGRGWLRPSSRGLVLVTSRNGDRRVWGSKAQIIPFEPLEDEAATRILLDLAPQGGSASEAGELARRLGGLPLALHLVGSHLSSPFTRWRDFASYRRALDEDGALHTADVQDRRENARLLMTRTWELSLDHLALAGVPQARPLLRLLSCLAPMTPVPLDGLDADALAPLLGGSGTEEDPGPRLRAGLRGLERMGLIRVTGSADPAVVLHPVITDTNRAHLTGAPQDFVRLIRRTAVDLMARIPDEWRPENPSVWPRYTAFASHLQAVLELPAEELERDQAVRLAELVSGTARALTLSGASGTSGHLCELASVLGTGASAEHPALLAVRHELAFATSYRGRWRDAERIYREVLDARLRVLGADHLDTLETKHYLAWTVAIDGRYGSARTLYEEVFATRTRVLGEDHPDTLATRHELAWITACRGEWGDSEEMYRDVLARWGQVVGPDHLKALTSSHELGWAIANQGRYDEAEELLRRVLDRRTRLLGEHHPRTLTTRHELAWIAAARGEWRRAEKLYRDLLRSRSEVLGADHPETLTTEHELAWVRSMLGRREDAAQGYRVVLEARTRILGAGHLDTSLTRRAAEELSRGRVVRARHLT